jgi:hypothetical protein
MLVSEDGSARPLQWTTSVVKARQRKVHVSEAESAPPLEKSTRALKTRRESRVIEAM